MFIYLVKVQALILAARKEEQVAKATLQVYIDRFIEGTDTLREEAEKMYWIEKVYVPD